MARLLLTLVPVLALACGTHLTQTQQQQALERSMAAVDPLSEPAPPKEPPADGVPELNTEYWLGTEQSEQARIIEFGQQIQELQAKAASERGTEKFRGFHAKSHGCLHGELQPLADRPARSRFGLFAEGAGPMPVWVRYSNGVGWKQADDKLDARGMAVKVMDVPGAKYLDDEHATQDFLMTNSPTPVGADSEEFMKFAHANTSGTLAGLFFLISHPRHGNALTRTGAIDSAASVAYYSGGPFHLGAHQTIKYLARPCPGAAPRKPPHEGDDYLKNDLIAAAGEGFCYTLYAQFQVDAELTPIENASVVWDEEVSPPVALANIVMPAQQLAPQDLCDGLTFNPWHSIAAHKPMGSHNRARRVVYAASQQMREKKPEPSPWVPTAQAP